MQFVSFRSGLKDCKFNIGLGLPDSTKSYIGSLPYAARYPLGLFISPPENSRASLRVCLPPVATTPDR